MRGNCSFCWYWCNYWPSVFILSFHKYLDNSGYYSILAYLIWQMLIYNPNYNSTYIYNYLVFVLYIDITGWYWIHFYIGHTLSISCVYNCSAMLNLTCSAMLNLTIILIIKRKLKQWSTPISTKLTISSHLNSLNTKKSPRHISLCH
jgi:hypothetical protein